MAPLKVVLRPEAKVDADDIAAFYASCTEDGRLAARFLRVLYAAIDRVAAFPESCVADDLGLRRTAFQTFPYWLYYRISRQRIEIIGVLHMKRDPALWDRS